MRYPDTRGSACYLPRGTFLGMIDSNRGKHKPLPPVSRTSIRSFTTSSATVQRLSCRNAIYASPGGGTPSVSPRRNSCRRQ